jgi:Cys-tRNA(Pro) deacylase
MSEKAPVTPAIRVLRQYKVVYSEHLYAYEEKGGTAVSARELKVDEHAVVKTLIMENEKHEPLVILQHGDCEVSTKNLARLLDVKTISPCSPDVAHKHSGYLVGGTSPLGTRKAMPVFMEKTILDLPVIYLNGGKRGFLVGVDPQALLPILKPQLVEVAIHN